MKKNKLKLLFTLVFILLPLIFSLNLEHFKSTSSQGVDKNPQVETFDFIDSSVASNVIEIDLSQAKITMNDANDLAANTIENIEIIINDPLYFDSRITDVALITSETAKVLPGQVEFVSQTSTEKVYQATFGFNATGLTFSSYDPANSIENVEYEVSYDKLAVNFDSQLNSEDWLVFDLFFNSDQGKEKTIITGPKSPFSSDISNYSASAYLIDTNSDEQIIRIELKYNQLNWHVKPTEIDLVKGNQVINIKNTSEFWQDNNNGLITIEINVFDFNISLQSYYDVFVYYNTNYSNATEKITETIGYIYTSIIYPYYEEVYISASKEYIDITLIDLSKNVYWTPNGSSELDNLTSITYTIKDSYQTNEVNVTEEVIFSESNSFRVPWDQAKKNADDLPNTNESFNMSLIFEYPENPNDLGSEIVFVNSDIYFKFSNLTNPEIKSISVSESNSSFDSFYVNFEIYNPDNISYGLEYSIDDGQNYTDVLIQTDSNNQNFFIIDGLEQNQNYSIDVRIKNYPASQIKLQASSTKTKNSISTTNILLIIGIVLISLLIIGLVFYFLIKKTKVK